MSNVSNRMRRMVNKAEAAADNIVRECFINGEFVHYDAMATGVTGDLDTLYKGMTHIGSSTRYRINGVEAETDGLGHFYVLSDLVFAPYTEVPKREY